MDVKQMKQNKLKRILQFSIPYHSNVIADDHHDYGWFYTGNYVRGSGLWRR